MRLFQPLLAPQRLVLAVGAVLQRKCSLGVGEAGPGFELEYFAEAPDAYFAAEEVPFLL